MSNIIRSTNVWLFESSQLHFKLVLFRFRRIHVLYRYSDFKDEKAWILWFYRPLVSCMSLSGFIKLRVSVLSIINVLGVLSFVFCIILYSSMIRFSDNVVSHVSLIPFSSTSHLEIWRILLFFLSVIILNRIRDNRISTVT